MNFAALFLAVDLLITGASSLLATEVIRAGDRVSPANASVEGGTTGSSELYGLEVRRTVYVGQEIVASNTRAPRLVKRNQVVTVKYINGPLEITASGRAMSAAGQNDAVAVLNTQSRNMIQGIVQKDGTVLVK